MARSTRRLGRGLDSLVGRMTDEDIVATPSAERQVERRDSAGDAQTLERARHLPVASLSPNPFQPRLDIPESGILRLADSVRRSGVLQPIAVRWRDGRYEIIAGERRWAAAKAAGLSEVPVIVHEATDEQMLELALIENIQREDLNAIDRALAYRQFSTRFGLTPEQVGERVGEDRTTVVNYLRLLDLPDQIKALVARGALSMGHARCLLGATADDRRLALAQSVVENELSVRALEEVVRREKTGDGSETRGAAKKAVPSAHVEDLKRRFEEALRTKVTIREGRRKGTGRIVIEYYSLDDFDRIADRLGIAAGE